MTPLAKEKAAFKITGKYTGGIGVTGKWNPDAEGRFGNDWEAKARYHANDAPQPTMTERLERAQARADLGSELPKVTVNIPGKSTLQSKIKEKVKEKTSEAVGRATQNVLSRRAESEEQRLENLFSGSITHPAQLIPAIRAGTTTAGIVKNIIKRSK